MKSIFARVFVALLLGIGLCGKSFGEPNRQRENLRQLEAVNVIASLPQNPPQIGISKNSIQTSAELRLRQAGASIEEYGAILHIAVSVMRRDSLSVVYSVSTECSRGGKIEPFLDGVGLPFSAHCTVWQKRRFGICREASAQARITEMVNEQMDAFINDFLAANPKVQK